MADQFTAVDVQVTFTVLTTSSVLDGSLVEFGAALQGLIEGAAKVCAADSLHGVPGAISIATQSRVIDV